MTADLLREAAALMRARAEDATPGPWVCKSVPSSYVQWEGDIRTTGLGDDQADEIGQTFLHTDAVHIASWHPAVALAAALGLSCTAEALEARGTAAHLEPAERAWIEFARAYLATP